MNVLVNGASVSRGENSWPYFLQQLLGCDLVNLSLAGCGNTYIHETTIQEIAQRHYDLVLIMWAECGRLDFRVDDIKKFSDSKNSSWYQSLQNDWPSKIVLPINDQDYVEKNWIFSLGTLQGQRNDSVSKVFLPYHAITGYKQILESELIKMISLQAVLKSQKIPYLFMHWRPIKLFRRFQHLYDLVDWEKVYQDDCLEQIGQRNRWLQQDGVHPNHLAHKHYAELLYYRLRQETQAFSANLDNPDSSIA